MHRRGCGKAGAAFFSTPTGRCLAELCYDTYPVWTGIVAATIPHKPVSLEGSLYQEKRPYTPLPEKFRRKISLL
jgi:hypothetical protein